MAENGYAKAVLVTTDWLVEHGSDDNVVVAEVDENPDLYEEGHIPGAVKLHWRDDLQDPVERDVVDRETFERLLGDRGIGNDTTVVVYGDKNNWFAAYAYWYLKVYGHGDVRILDGGRQKWIDEGRELTTDVFSPAAQSYSAQERDESIRAYRDQVRGWVGASDRGLAGRRAARGPHPHGSLDSLGERRPRRRDVQVRGRAPRALRRQGHHGRAGSDCVLPHRRAQRPHVVRPSRAARIRAGAELRRLMDRVGESSRRSDRKGLLTV
jgi:rhodanese-related sulfurtransferase